MRVCNPHHSRLSLSLSLSLSHPCACIGDDNDLGRDYDFLSSVEMLVLDSCEMLQMQNWEHVELLLRVMNKVPNKVERRPTLSAVSVSDSPFVFDESFHYLPWDSRFVLDDFPNCYAQWNY